MDGRIYTPEDDIDTLHEDLGRARRHLWDLEQAEMQGRVALKDIHRNALRQTREKVAALERELAEACAQEIAAAEAHELCFEDEEAQV